MTSQKNDRSETVSMGYCWQAGEPLGPGPCGVGERDDQQIVHHRLLVGVADSRRALLGRRARGGAVPRQPQLRQLNGRALPCAVARGRLPGPVRAAPRVRRLRLRQWRWWQRWRRWWRRRRRRRPNARLQALYEPWRRRLPARAVRALHRPLIVQWGKHRLCVLDRRYAVDIHRR